MMYSIIPETEFMIDRDKSVKYLRNRGVFDNTYIDFMETARFGNLAPNTIEIAGCEYSISCFLAVTGDAVNDIERINMNISLNIGSSIAIGMLEGDDVICYNTESNAYYAWLIENGDGEKVHLGNTFDQLLKQIRWE